MVFTNHTPRITIDNSFSGLCDVFNEQENPEVIAEQMIRKMRLITSVHKTLLEMWSMHRGDKGRCMQLKKGCKPLKASQKMPKSRCANLERKDHCSVIGKGHISLLSAKGFQEQDHGSRMCILKDFKGQCQEQSRKDLQLYLSIE